MIVRYAVALLLVSCGGRLAPAELPPECVPPETLRCQWETLNDGTGPSDHRQVCLDGNETWYIYPSGEAWHVVGESDVRCRVGPDGTVLYLGHG